MTKDSVADLIRRAREAKGLSLAGVGASLNLTPESARDLESYDDEIVMCVSIAQIFRLSALLNIPLRSLFPGVEEGEGLPLDQLRDQVQRHCAVNSLTIPQFEDAAGWELSAFMSDPASAVDDWNIDCLKDVCAGVGQDWKQYLRGMENAQPESGHVRK